VDPLAPGLWTKDCTEELLAELQSVEAPLDVVATAADIAARAHPDLAAAPQLAAYLERIALPSVHPPLPPTPIRPSTAFLAAGVSARRAAQICGSWALLLLPDRAGDERSRMLLCLVNYVNDAVVAPPWWPRRRRRPREGLSSHAPPPAAGAAGRQQRRVRVPPGPPRERPRAGGEARGRHRGAERAA
jgi:hypothetical protein